jgi:hypothetical protein
VRLLAGDGGPVGSGSALACGSYDIQVGLAMNLKFGSSWITNEKIVHIMADEENVTWF